MAAPRTIVLVHGAWHGAWCWAAVQVALDARGIPSLAVDLPGRGASVDPLGDLTTDIDHLVRVLAHDRGDLVLVGHSYGGAVVGGAATSTDAVRHVVFVTAFALQADETINDIVRGVASPTPRLRDAIVMRDDGTSVLDPGVAPEALYGCCSPPVIAAALPRLAPHPMVSFSQPPGAAPFGALPTSYVRCTLDRSVPLEQQDHMAARCDDVATIETDHSPMLSATASLVDVIEPLARAGPA